MGARGTACQSTEAFSRRAFLLAWCFLAIATAIGVLLRLQPLRPIPGLNHAYFLHAHSHTAFLGWVYNAFFALALPFFIAPGERGGFRTLFIVTQVATGGMLVMFPIQGYARESIAFSSLHLVCSGVFAWKLLRRGQAMGVVRTALRWAFGFLFLSAVGPLALGPLAAADLRGSPWYSMAIYFYLHFQYNGWFLFFLLALVLQRGAGFVPVSSERFARWAVHALAIGCVVTLALSALWMSPARWVYRVGLAGATAQLAGGVLLLRWLRTCPQLFASRIAAGLARIAFAGFAVKLGLQFAAGWPALSALATQRMIVVGFLHLVFLATVTPMLIAWASEHGWMQFRRTATTGLGLFGAGALVTELTLFLPTGAALLPELPTWPRVHETLAGAGVLMLVGIVLMLTSFRRQPEPKAPGGRPY